MRDPAISPDGRLMFAHAHWDWNIIQVQGGTAERHPVSSTRLDANPVFSPDGKRIVFSSRRTGTIQVWTANADGSQPVQLTRLGQHSASPRWSPDGRWIAFDSEENGRWDVWLARAEGGMPRRITSHSSDENEPSFSQDGKWIYFNSTRSGRTEIYRTPFGGGNEEQITTGGGSLARESPDGKTVYYALTQGTSSTLMETAVTGGGERPLGINFTGRGFQVMSDGIYFMTPPASAVDSSWSMHPLSVLGSPTRYGPRRSGTRRQWGIHFYDFATKTIREVHRGVIGLRPGRGFSVSPDRKTFLYVADEGTGWDLMLVENFR
jgi:Tol biopolymer transport system component